MKEGAIDRERAVITHHQATEVAEPGVSAFDNPTALVPPQRSAILRCGFLPVRAMRRDQFDSAPRQPLAQRIAVVGFVGDHPHRLLPGTPSEGTLPKEDRGRRPPPSTSSPCPAWFFRLRSPFFRGSKAPFQKRFAPL